MKCIAFSSLNREESLALGSYMLNDATPMWERKIWTFVTSWLSDSEDSISVSTSGSTGKPKKIKHSKTAMMNSANTTCRALELKAGNHALLCLPADKISGMMMIVRCIQCQMDMYYIQPSANPLNDLTKESHFHFAAFTPMQLFGILSNAELSERLEQIQKVIIGGEGIGSALIKKLAMLNNELYATFGMTETISHVALKRLNGTSSSAHYKVLESVAISTDEHSRLIIDAPALNVHLLLTNDIVTLLSSNEFEWIGRADSVINSGGVKIHPEVIEQMLEPLMEKPFFVCAVPDELTGEKPAVVIESTSIQESDITKLQKSFDALSPIERPKVILLCPLFERTENNKLKRNESLQKCVARFEI